ncbi:MAG TPA: hypothetical protein PKX05_05320 [bacterium]|nr:hypothetical protein [bacterium]
MKKLIGLLIICGFLFPAHAKDTNQHARDSEKTLKITGEIVSVDTQQFVFTIIDISGSQKKLFASPINITNIVKNEPVEVSYKQTTDGNFKALKIKPIKRKKTKKIKN